MWIHTNTQHICKVFAYVFNYSYTVVKNGEKTLMYMKIQAVFIHKETINKDPKFIQLENSTNRNR